MTIEQSLLAAISALASVVVVLWNITRIYEKECRDDRKRLWETIDSLLENSCTVGSCDLRKQIRMAHVKSDKIKEKVAKHDDSSIIKRIIPLLPFFWFGRPPLS